MAGEVIVNFLPRQRFVPVKRGDQNGMVMLNIHRDEIEISIRDHQLLPKSPIHCQMHVFERC